MPESLRKGLVRLLFKKGDWSDLHNWRTITLLNTNYKILAKVLARRLSTVLDTLVSEAQTCTVPGAIINLDQEKAFDRVNWTYLHSVLEAFGFGPYFCGGIKIFYRQVDCHILLNGWKTQFISISQGVHQGCPLLPLLYVLAAELLVVNVLSNTQILGIPLPLGETAAKVAAYGWQYYVLCGI